MRIYSLCGALLTFLSTPALSLAVIDQVSDGEDIHLWVIFAVGGCLGALSLREHRELCEKHIDTTNSIGKWLLRIGCGILILAMILPSVNSHTGEQLVGAWGLLKIAQGIYISGLVDGLSAQKENSLRHDHFE